MFAIKTMRQPKNDRQIIYNFILHFLQFLCVCVIIAVLWINALPIELLLIVIFRVLVSHTKNGNYSVGLSIKRNSVEFIKKNFTNHPFRPYWRCKSCVRFGSCSNFSWPTNYSDNCENCFEVCHDDEENLFRTKKKMIENPKKRNVGDERWWKSLFHSFEWKRKKYSQ